MQIQHKNLDCKALGERLKKIRGKENQSDFASKYGLSQADISRLERGEVANPPIDGLFNICINNNRTFEWLLYGDEPEYRKERKEVIPGEDKQPISLQNNDVAYIVRYLQCTGEEKRFIDKLTDIFQGPNEQAKMAVKMNIDQFWIQKDARSTVDNNYIDKLKDTKTQADCQEGIKKASG